VTAIEAGASGFATVDADFAVVSEEIKLMPKSYWEDKP